ncbi:unnamed protein product [Spirodela intermedia]|uniref:Uncharacterized protein n=2 Tax=Spirodela intermedia TaxID=51605 RepID=A0A7I8LLW2_SPIIN|nr:unnamed protein product [Spirodela intermedia]CAA6673611.1 unnamed protein product [Spirodela intermedia]CAA7410852.1 unnamed protein product [Spirodela intermedia]
MGGWISTCLPHAWDPWRLIQILFN